MNTDSLNSLWISSLCIRNVEQIVETAGQVVAGTRLGQTEDAHFEALDDVAAVGAEFGRGKGLEADARSSRSRGSTRSCIAEIDWPGGSARRAFVWRQSRWRARGSRDRERPRGLHGDALGDQWGRRIFAACAERPTGRAEARGYSAAASAAKRSLATKSSTERRAAIFRRPLSVTM